MARFPPGRYRLHRHHDHQGHHGNPAPGWPPAPPSPPSPLVTLATRRHPGHHHHHHPWLPWPPWSSVPRCPRYCNSWPQLSEMLHFQRLNVGKVAKRKIVSEPARFKNALTCRFTVAKMGANNKMQLFRHSRLGNTRTWPRRDSYRPQTRFAGGQMSLERESVSAVAPPEIPATPRPAVLQRC